EEQAAVLLGPLRALSEGAGGYGAAIEGEQAALSLWVRVLIQGTKRRRDDGQGQFEEDYQELLGALDGLAAAGGPVSGGPARRGGLDAAREAMAAAWLKLDQAGVPGDAPQVLVDTDLGRYVELSLGYERAVKAFEDALDAGAPVHEAREALRISSTVAAAVAAFASFVAAVAAPPSPPVDTRVGWLGRRHDVLLSVLDSKLGVDLVDRYGLRARLVRAGEAVRAARLAVGGGAVGGYPAAVAAWAAVIEQVEAVV